MHQQGILKTDDLITRFFRLCTEMCVDLCYRALLDQSQNPAVIRTKCFHTLDAFVRLIALLIKHSGDSTNTITKINLLNKVRTITGTLLYPPQTKFGGVYRNRPVRPFMYLASATPPKRLIEVL